MQSRSLILILALTVVVSACGAESSSESTSPEASEATQAETLIELASAEPDATTSTSTTTTMVMSQGAMRTSTMMERHRATVPAEYAGLTNPVAADEASLARGAEAYATCAVCHGDGGLGDGTAAVALDPAPANIAHTSQMMGDDYFFWRITEGGAEFGTAMPAWGEALDEQTRWDLITYINALGVGTASPGRGGGGQAFNPEAQATQQTALLAVAVEQGLITQAESDGFADAHVIVDARMAELRGTSSAEGVDTTLPAVLAELVGSGELTQSQADVFLSVHDRLSGAGLMP